VPVGALVVIAKEEFAVGTEGPFVFGRADAEDVVGLNPNDMGISAEAGSVECDGALWWVVNRSRKRPLLLDDDDDDDGGGPSSASTAASAMPSTSPA
jgi:hypothetical protein